jgi:hypothetical protein
MADTAWDYLEVSVNLSKQRWKDSSGRAVRLRKGNTAPILADLGAEGWELTGTVPLERASESYRLYFKRPRVAEVPPDVEG